MNRPEPLDTLCALVNVDFRDISFIDALERLAAFGHITFRMNPELKGVPYVTVCIAFDRDAGKTLNDALNKWLDEK